MPSTSKEKIHLPTVSLRQALPFLQAAKGAGCDIDSLLEPFALDESSFDRENNVVAAAIMYDLIDALAAASGDPYCGATLGATQPLNQLLAIEDLSRGMSLGDFLLAVCLEKFQQVNSTTFSLLTEGTRSEFRSVRTTDGGREPRHVDAYGAASVIAMLRETVGPPWDGSSVLVTVCDPSVLPPHYYGVRLAQGNTLGFSVSFPGSWLLLPAALHDHSRPRKDSARGSVSIDDTLPALQSILSTHLHEPGLDTARVAQLCGVGSRTLIRRLSGQGTTLKRELDQLRRERAERALTTTPDNISDIGTRLGYPDPSVFARAFRRWTGVTPREYRKEVGSQ